MRVYVCTYFHIIALEENLHVKPIATVVKFCLYIKFCGFVYMKHVIVYICGVVLRDEAGNKYAWESSRSIKIVCSCTCGLWPPCLLERNQTILILRRRTQNQNCLCQRIFKHEDILYNKRRCSKHLQTRYIYKILRKTMIYFIRRSKIIYMTESMAVRRLPRSNLIRNG